MNVDGAGETTGYTQNTPNDNGVYITNTSGGSKCPPAQWLKLGDNWVWWNGKCSTYSVNPIMDPPGDEEENEVYLHDKSWNPKPIPDNNPHFMKQ